jgi:hypothetical protein
VRQISEIIPLVGKPVRVRNGKHSFEGTLLGPSKRTFAKADGAAPGLTLVGKDFRLEFAWWDWQVEPVRLEAAELVMMEAAE